MPNKLSDLKGKIYKIKILLVFSGLVFVTGARGDEIIKNQVEDRNIIISQIVGGEPNVLLILDLSGSMGLSYGQNQLASWDQETSVQVCEAHRCTGINNCDSSTQRIVASQCAEKAAGTSVCSSIACDDAECETQDDFDRLLTCVQAKAPTFNMSPIFDRRCGNNDGIFTETASSCNSDTERQFASAAIESGAGLTQCMTLHCRANSDPACDQGTEYTNFRNCMNASQAITANEDVACTGGTQNCQGVPGRGSSRLDMALNVFFSFLDADNSLATKNCDDPNRLFDGVSTSISCRDYMNTPFRDVSGIVRGNSQLPITGGTDTNLIDELTDEDAEILEIRFRPMRYSGGGSSGCTGSSTFEIGGSGFGNPIGTSLDNVWSFYRNRIARGGTPLALSLGFDDNNGSSIGGGNVVVNDALGAFRGQLNPSADPAVSCRPEFVIVITDGEDRCSPSPPGIASTNANHRSSIQAVSNLRTYYARNPEGGVKKEILTFVIGIGIINPEGIIALNAMALAGGTHTTGVIQHNAPDGIAIGSVNITNVLPSGSQFQVFKDLGIAKDIETSPTNATLADCKTPSNASGAHCHFQGQDIFNNEFFDTGAPFAAAEPLKDFAFFANNADEFTAALQSALEIIQELSSSTTGVSPTSPLSAASVSLRERILLANLTPLLTERLWQGRLALYGFVDEPGNPGSKVVIRKPDLGADLTDPAVVDSFRIFDNNGVLNANAMQFFWDAGKLLTERDISAVPRHLFTVIRTDPSTIDEEIDSATSQVLRLRYEGDKDDFNLSNTNLNLAQFGISDADVTGPFPTYCTAVPPDGFGDCTADCTVDPLTGNIVTPASAQCQTCMEDCIRDRTIDFMTGNTKIFPLGDPLGSPTTAGQTLDSFGYNCPNLDDGDTTNDDYTHCQIKLGDIFHSTPTLVGSPSPLFFDVGFQAFASQFKDRSATVYVGANDGFMHAFHGGELVSIPPGGTVTNPFNLEEESVPFFNPGTGVELFGFAPPSFVSDSISENGPESPSGITPPDYRFGDFKTFVAEKNEERSFMDGSALVADIFVDGYSNGIDDAICSGASSDLDGVIDSCGSEWHTLYITGYRNGGGGYSALDVTNVECAGGVNTDCSSIGKHLANGPDYPTHLWTLFDHDFGNTWSEPTVGRVRMTADNGGTDVTTDRWVMFVGGGMDPLDTDPTDGVTFGNAFYAIDIPTGKIIFKFNPDDPIPSTLTDTDLAEMTCDMSARVGVFDLNADGFMDVAYAGDTCGRLWRFDISRPIVADDLTQTGLRGDADITAPNWTGDIAFCATADLSQCLDPTTIAFDAENNNCQRRPIFFAPTAVFDNQGNLHIIFSTGNRRNPTDSCQFGKLYNFIDSSVPAFLAGGTAISQSTITEADFDSGQILDLVPLAGVQDQFTIQGGTTINNQGKFIVRLPGNLDVSVSPAIESSLGEKGFGTPVVITGVLLFTTFAPDTGSTANPCIAGVGHGRLFALDYLTGEPAMARVPGAQNLLGGSTAQKEATAGKTVAEGMPTPAQLTFGARGSVIMAVAFSGGAAAGGANFLLLELPQLATKTQTLFWEELL